MMIQGIIVDVNGTLIDIHTEEGNEEIYRAISHFLTYQRIYLHRWEVKDAYYRIMEKQRSSSVEEYPEFDTVEVWWKIISKYSDSSLLPSNKLGQIPLSSLKCTGASPVYACNSIRM